MKKLIIDRRILAGLILIITGFVLLLIAPLLLDKGRADLFIMSGYGASLSETPGENQVLSYSIDLSNNGRSYYKIKSLEPVISQEMEPYVLEGITIISVNKKLSPNKTIKIHGELKVNTSQMSQEEIRDLLYDLKQFKIIYDDNQEMILDNDIPN
ncbi:hypothetical protein J41TS12_12290 [Paenibacillus antibioticophila]|uniref:Uncharacterized protein n=1 Tax=Paenibacillus antibioticophila TaxID=1274374 RepID=A0A919XRT9_9BACL|nr:hypothetical protein [Paenibacillus antibioticophila]GIO36368.1 hypothetical protein J41TS12_12290 [Paenibacillus antibioticophila]